MGDAGAILCVFSLSDIAVNFSVASLSSSALRTLRTELDSIDRFDICTT